MPERSEFVQGTPCWADLATTDAEAAATFYATIFGWTAEPVPDPAAGGYTMLYLDGRNVAALAPTAGADRPPAWQTYVRVDDADKTAELVTTAGGTVLMPPMDVFGSGRMAVFADPTGAAVAVWQPAEHTGFAVTDEPNTYTWTELATRDPEGAIAFYADVFGWGHETSESMGMAYTEFKVGDRSIAGMMAMDENIPADVPSYWMPYFEVTDPARTTAEASALGAQTFAEPMEIPTVGTFAILRDPQGATFGVIRTERSA
jgi:predicted enzyme related to lactoylglutathione lyase